MKKVLLGTSALIAAGIIASPAAAQLEMSVSGEIRFETGFFSEANDDNNGESISHAMGTDVETITFRASGLSDTGIGYGGLIDLTDDGTPNLTVDEASVFIAGGFGTVTLGNNDGASDISVGVPTAGTGITDGGYGDYVRNEGYVLFQHNDDGDAAKISYTTGAVDGLTSGVAALEQNNIELGISYAPDSDQNLDSGNNTAPGNTTGSFGVDGTGAIAANALEPNWVHVFEVGARWSPTFGAVTVTPSASATVAIDQNGRPDIDANVNWQAGLNVSTGGFAVGVNVVNNRLGFVENAQENWGVNTGATYTTGPWTFGVAYSFSTVELAGVAAIDSRESHTYGAGVSYNWLPGMTLHADVVGFNAEGADNANYTVGGIGSPGLGINDADNSGVVGLTRVSVNF